MVPVPYLSKIKVLGINPTGKRSQRDTDEHISEPEASPSIQRTANQVKYPFVDFIFLSLQCLEHGGIQFAYFVISSTYLDFFTEADSDSRQHKIDLTIADLLPCTNPFLSNSFWVVSTNERLHFVSPHVCVLCM